LLQKVGVAVPELPGAMLASEDPLSSGLGRFSFS